MLLLKRIKYDFSRHFSSCWKCGFESFKSCQVFCEKCNFIQKPPQNYNYYTILGLKEEFPIENALLKSKFRALQSLLHPDKFSNKSEEEKAISSEYSSLVNKAFQSLQVPLKRAEHLLKVKTGEQLKEEEVSQDARFLMDIMELNEEVEDVDSPEKLKELNLKNKEKLQEISKQLQKSFQENDFDSVKTNIIKLKYFSSLSHRINEILREKGIVE